MGPEEAVATRQSAIDALCRLLHDGQSERAVPLVDETLAGDPGQGGNEALVAKLYVIKFAALFNLERFEECPAVADALHASLSRCDEPTLRGEFHALAGGVAHFQGMLERCVTHLVRGARALERVKVDSKDAADAWQDLATVYSYIGFHEEAVATQAIANQVAANAGAPAVHYAHPEILLRHALWLDHQGDTAGCVSELTRVYTSFDPGRLERWDLPHFAYAGARLAALGEPAGPDPAPVLAACPPTTPEEEGLHLLAEACLAIADARPREALARLESPVLSGTVQDAEVLRVRALALAAAGDHKAALAAERSAIAAIVNGPGRLNRLYIEGVTARLDQDDLRRSLRRYTDEAHTDPLTGLPNRRHLERYISDLVYRGARGIVAVADLNGFKAINTVHGHLSGDEVLQQVAALMTRALRAGDFLARYGGDEFVVILPETALPEATGVSARLARAVARFDWAGLVPGTGASLAIGLAEFGPDTDFAHAFQEADLAMLQEKADGSPR